MENGDPRKAAVGLILMYHRIGVSGLDPWGLAVSPAHFAEHLDVLRQHGRPAPLTRVVEALRNGTLPSRTLVVTFDDGYADNLYNARPLLERYDVPATVFVATGHIGSDREFWWDELEEILLMPEGLPGQLHLNANGRTLEWPLGDARRYPEEQRRSDRQGRAAGHGGPSPRDALYRAAHRALLPMDSGERGSALDQLRGWAGVRSGLRQSHRPLSRDEVVTLAQGPLIEVGSHSTTHTSLPSLTVTSQREEIRQSKLALEGLLGRPVVNFAYPYGAHAAETAILLQEEGFASACSTKSGLLNLESHLFRLPRIKVRDWDGETLSSVLSEWLLR